MPGISDLNQISAFEDYVEAHVIRDESVVNEAESVYGSNRFMDTLANCK